MIHVLNHPHSFVKDNKVISTAIFADHNHDLIDAVKVTLQADWVQCCCDYQRFITEGATWDGKNFIHPDGSLIPREPEPQPEPEPVEE